MREIVTLHAPGALPGIPGESHGPGTFLVDYDTRTIEELKPEDVPEVAARLLALPLLEQPELSTPPPGAEQEEPST